MDLWHETSHSFFFQSSPGDFSYCQPTNHHRSRSSVKTSSHDLWFWGLHWSEEEGRCCALFNPSAPFDCFCRGKIIGKFPCFVLGLLVLCLLSFFWQRYSTGSEGVECPLFFLSLTGEKSSSELLCTSSFPVSTRGLSPVRVSDAINQGEKLCEIKILLGSLHPSFDARNLPRNGYYHNSILRNVDH